MRLKSQPGILARASPSNIMRLLVLMTAAAFMNLTRAEGEGKQSNLSSCAVIITPFAPFPKYRNPTTRLALQK